MGGGALDGPKRAVLNSLKFSDEAEKTKKLLDNNFCLAPGLQKNISYRGVSGL